jgi:hypothetical protein
MGYLSSAAQMIVRYRTVNVQSRGCVNLAYGSSSKECADCALELCKPQTGMSCNRFYPTSEMLSEQVDDVQRMVADERARQNYGFRQFGFRRKLLRTQSSSVAKPCAPSIF